MLSDTLFASVAPDMTPRLNRAREAVASAVAAMSGTAESPRSERGARVAAAREAVVAYTRWMRDQGASAATVIAHVKALVRGAPIRVAHELHDALQRWTISAYYQAD
jgi:hypothetical protein